MDEIAKKYGLKVIYDAAHAFGETYKGRGIGQFGDVSCFSFHATKVFNTIEGGAACYADAKFGEKLYGLKNFGIRGPECVDAVGANAKMNEFCAAMGLCNLRHIDRAIEKRKNIVECYRNLLSNVKGMYIGNIQKDVKSNYSYFPVVIDEVEFGMTRNQLFVKLENHGVSARKYFYPLTNTFSCFRGKYDVLMTPIAQYISDRVLTLPLYEDLEIELVEKICETILEAAKQN